MNKVLFLWLSKKDFYPQKIIELGYDLAIDQVFVNSSLLSKFIRRIIIILDIVPLLSLWINTWKNDTYKYNTIIVHASKLIPPIVKYIRKKNPEIRIMIWYWNPVAKSVKLKKFKNLNCEIWSFDESDCKKYELKYNTQYFFKNIQLPSSTIKYDIFFIGRDKGRLSQLLHLEKKFNELGLTTYFHIVTDERFIKTKKYPFKQTLSYNQILKLISESKVILDIVSPNQQGLTIRVLEALMFEKKLITNDTNFKKYDFYNSNNIFILDIDNLEKLTDFIDSSYHYNSGNIISKYDFNSWINRFFN